MPHNLLYGLLGLLILAAVVYVVKLVLDELGLPPRINKIAVLIVGVSFLVILLWYVFSLVPW